MIKYVLCILFFTTLCIPSFAQDSLKANQCNYQKEPCWIQMMNDPSVNYFEAQKAFNEFWKARGGEPFVSENAKERAQHNSTNTRPNDKKKETQNQQYIIEYKKFKNWSEEVKPYVQQDGRILSKEERNTIYEGQRNTK